VMRCGGARVGGSGRAAAGMRGSAATTGSTGCPTSACAPAGLAQGAAVPDTGAGAGPARFGCASCKGLLCWPAGGSAILWLFRRAAALVVGSAAAQLGSTPSPGPLCGAASPAWATPAASGPGRGCLNASDAAHGAPVSAWDTSTAPGCAMFPRLGAAGMASMEAVPAEGCGVAAPGLVGAARAAAEVVWGSCADCPIVVAPPTAAAAACKGCAAAWELDRGSPAAHGALVSCQGLVQSAWGPESRSPVTCPMENNPNAR